VLTSLPSGGDVHPECRRAVEVAAGLLEQLGHVVEASWPAALAEPDFTECTRVRSGASIAAQLDAWSERTGQPIGEHDVEPGTWLVAEAGRSTSAPKLAGALARLQVIGRGIEGWWSEGNDLLLTPTFCEPPPHLGEFHAPEEPWRGLVRSGPMIEFTQPFNVTGQPAISLPLYWDPVGLPIGVQLAAAHGREDVLLRIASQLEASSPWADRYPAPMVEREPA
jgi:amidase